MKHSRDHRYLLLLIGILTSQVALKASDTALYVINNITSNPMVLVSEFDSNLLLADNAGVLYAWSHSEKRIIYQSHFDGEIHLVHYHKSSGNILIVFYNYNKELWQLLILDKKFGVLDSLTLYEPVSSLASFNEEILLGSTDGRIIELSMTQRRVGQLTSFNYKFNSGVQKIIQFGSDSIAVFLFSGEINLFRKSGNRSWIRFRNLLPVDENNFCFNAEFQDGLFLVRRSKGYELRNMDLRQVEAKFPKIGTTKFYGRGKIISFSGTGNLIIYSYMHNGLFSINDYYQSNLSAVGKLQSKSHYELPKYIIHQNYHHKAQDSILWTRSNVSSYAIGNKHVAMGYLTGVFELFGINDTHSKRFEIENNRIPICITLPDFTNNKNMVLLSTTDNSIYGYYYPSGTEYFATYGYTSSTPLVHDIRTNTFALLRQRSLGIEFHSSRFEQVDNRVPITYNFKADAVMSSVNRNDKTMMILFEDSLMFIYDYQHKKQICQRKLYSSICEVLPVKYGYLLLTEDGKLFSLVGIRLNLVDSGITDISLTDKINQTCIITKDDQLAFINFVRKERVKRSSGILAPNIAGKNLLHATYTNSKEGLKFIVCEKEKLETVSNDYNDFLNDALFLGGDEMAYVDMNGNLIIVETILESR